jgi:hypothetical protein
MRFLVRYLLFPAFLLLFSCDKMPLSVSCSGCTKDEPTTVVLEISVDKSAGDAIDGAVIRIYSGNLEDSVLLYSTNTSGTALNYSASVNKKYTLTATYIINGSTYIAVDAITPRVKYETSQCADPCYYVYDKKVNLKLKYY